MSLDFVILFIYLFSTFAIGIWKGKNIKTIEQFSVSNRNFSNFVLMATIFATLIGGGATLGVIEQIHSAGIIFGLIFAGQIIQKIIIILFVAPKFGKFMNRISCGGIIEEMYGSHAKIITGIVAFIVSAGAIAAQVTAMGYVFEFFLGMDKVTGILMSASIVVLYSAFGGMSSVVATDVFQFAILIVAIPLICNLGLIKVGGYQQLISSIPQDFLDFSKHKKLIYTQAIPLFIYLSIPFEALMAQRLLMAKNISQLKSSLKMGVLIETPFTIVIIVIGLIAVVLFPDTPSRLVMPTLVHELLPIGFRGLAMAGILAVIMSTADSNLNTAAVALIHDTVKPLVKVKNELGLARIVTVTIGVISIVIATSFTNVIEILSSILSIWSSTILIPMFLGMLGVVISKRGFFACIIVGSLCHALGHFYLAQIYDWLSGFLVGFLGNLTTFVIFLLLKKDSFKSFIKKFKKPNTKNKTYLSFTALLRSIKNIPRFLRYISYQYSADRVDAYGSHYVLFGAFAVINYLLPIFMWESDIPQNSYVLISIMRVIAGILCFFLVIHEIWPSKLKKYLPVYWHLTLLYSLSFMSSFTLLLNQSSFASIINVAIALFFLVILVDWLSFIILFGLGTLLSVPVYEYLVGYHHSINIYIPNEMIYLYIFTILIGGIFSSNKDLIQKKIVATKDQMNKHLKSVVENRTAHLEDALNVKKDVLNNLSHEIRTPMQGIIGISRELSLNWKNLSEKERHKYVNLMSESGDRLMTLVNSILDLSKFEYGEMTFDLKPNINIHNIIHSVVKRFKTVSSTEERNLSISIKAKEGLNVSVMCDPIKTSQLFTNLINAAIRYSKTNGTIEIVIDQHKNNLRIQIKQNGNNIPNGEEESIFEIFTETQKYNTLSTVNFGLALCKEIVKAHNGTLKAENNSKHTGSVFTVTLPQTAQTCPIYLNKSESTKTLINKKSQIKRILLVDDEQICLESVGIILNSMGYEVLMADGGKKALEILSQEKNIDLMLLDLMMPDIYGLDVLKTMKSDSTLKNIPVIIQSGMADINELEVSLKAGAEGFIKKPYTRKDLDLHIKKLH